MTKIQALFVKYWRTKKLMSYRTVHSRYQKRYVRESDWTFNKATQARRDSMLGKCKTDEQRKKLNEILWNLPDGSQIGGRNLCRAAQGVLNEQWDDTEIIF